MRGLSAQEVESLYHQLLALLESMPDMGIGILSIEAQRWLGRASAVVAKVGDVSEKVALAAALSFRDSNRPAKSNEEILTILYRTLGCLELALPEGVAGVFIPANSPHSAYVATQKVFGSLVDQGLIVDAYLDHIFFADFVSLLPPALPVQLLSDSATVKSTLIPAFQRWSRECDSPQRVELRLSEGRALHDRVIMDSRNVYVMSQSFNGLATRSSATIMPAPPEVATAKRQAYERLWAAAEPVAA